LPEEEEPWFAASQLIKRMAMMNVVFCAGRVSGVARQYHAERDEWAESF